LGTLDMTALTRRLTHELAILGRAGVIGLGLIAFSVAFVVQGLWPQYRELRSAHERHERLSQRPPATPGNTLVGVDDQLGRFAKHFPAPDQARQDILQLQSFAATHGVELRSGDYRVVPDPASGLLRHQVVLPVRGQYPNLRAFVAEAFDQLPWLALSSASFARGAGAAPSIEGQLRFTLYTVGS